MLIDTGLTEHENVFALYKDAVGDSSLLFSNYDFTSTTATAISDYQAKIDGVSYTINTKSKIGTPEGTVDFHYQRLDLDKQYKYFNGTYTLEELEDTTDNTILNRIDSVVPVLHDSVVITVDTSGKSIKIKAKDDSLVYIGEINLTYTDKQPTQPVPANTTHLGKLQWSDGTNLENERNKDLFVVPDEFEIDALKY